MNTEGYSQVGSPWGIGHMLSTHPCFKLSEVTVDNHGIAKIESINELQ